MQGITIPTYITLFRMLLVPIYGWCVLQYGFSLKELQPNESFRIASCTLFAIAAISDAVDGIIARIFNMRSELGAYLDPFADKVLLLTSIIFMAQYFENWWQMPLWFMIIVVSRDLLIIYGVWLLKSRRKPIKFLPHWSGKFCTGLQIAVVSFYLLQWVQLGFLTTILASLLTLWSGVVYFHHGWTLLQLPSETDDEHQPLFKFK